MKKLSILLILSLGMMLCQNVFAQQPESIYGDEVKFDVKMKYVYTMEDAIMASMKSKKPIFVNCFADWAMPCHGMNKYVFTNQEFADYMDQNFVCLFLDVATDAGKAIAKQYDVDSYAHYLILDADGELLLRISGGKKLPEFQEYVATALNPETTLPATEKAFKEGKRDKKTLSNYLKVLELAYDAKKFREIDSIYMPMLDESEYAKKENWMAFSEMIKSRENNKYYDYLTSHKADFVAENGADVVNRFLENAIVMEVYKYATGKEAYDPMALLKSYREMVRVELPDSAQIWKFYQIAKLRGENKTAELYTYLKENRNPLGQFALYIDQSLASSAKTVEEKDALLAYLNETVAAEKYESNKKSLQRLITELTLVDGIKFEKDVTFEQALAKAGKEGKQLFMDCFTTWCGPCKVMSNDVFTLKEVGEYFNKRFVSIKMDMETPEGRELGKKYEVKAYPTMLVIDAQGNVAKRIVGACSGPDLIKKCEE